MQYAEVVEYASGLARDMMGELVENVATGLDTYSIRQPLGVSQELLDVANSTYKCRIQLLSCAHHD